MVDAVEVTHNHELRVTLTTVTGLGTSSLLHGQTRLHYPEKSVDDIQVDHKPSRASNNEIDPASATVDSKTINKSKKQPKTRSINAKQSNAGLKDDSSTNINKVAESEKNATKSQVVEKEVLDQKQSTKLSPTQTKQSNEYQPKVGVYDEDKFVDAETYLVGRMKRVQKKLVWL